MLNRREFTNKYYPWAKEFSVELHELENFAGRRIVDNLIADLYQNYSEQELKSPWVKIDFKNPESFPSDGQSVTYFFLPFGTVHDGSYHSGTFCSTSGFCDAHDATHWKPREC